MTDTVVAPSPLAPFVVTVPAVPGPAAAGSLP